MNNRSSESTVDSVAFIVAANETADAFLAPHIRELAADFQITVIGNRVSECNEIDPRAILTDLTIERSMNIFADIRACVSLYRIFRREKFDAVQSMTPKAGLLTALAAFAARIPTRIHWFTGQVWATRSGLSRQILKSLDRVTATLSTHLLVDSHSQRDFLDINSVAKTRKTLVLANGSTRGVDCNRFRMNKSRRGSVRSNLGIPKEDKIVLFIGRLNREKGVSDLLDAFGSLPTNLGAHLVLVGTDEEGFAEKSPMGKSPAPTNVYFVGHQANVLDFLIDADIFVLPSHREGLPISLLEAGAVGLPIIGTEINGITDVIENGLNGMLVPSADSGRLFYALQTLLLDDDLRKRLGQGAMDSIRLRFREELLTNAYKRFLCAALVKTASRP